jgi:hypothetical protein
MKILLVGIMALACVTSFAEEPLYELLVAESTLASNSDLDPNQDPSKPIIKWEEGETAYDQNFVFKSRKGIMYFTFYLPSLAFPLEYGNALGFCESRGMELITSDDISELEAMGPNRRLGFKLWIYNEPIRWRESRNVEEEVAFEERAKKKAYIFVRHNIGKKPTDWSRYLKTDGLDTDRIVCRGIPAENR